VPVVEAISSFIDATGLLPGRTQLETYAREQGFALAKRERGIPWTDYVNRTDIFRLQRGLPMPTEWYDSTTPPAETTIFSAARPYQPKHRWTRELVLERLAEYLHVLQASGSPTRPSQRDYRARFREDRHWPSASTVQRHGRFHDLLDEARRQSRT
jgi:hypothetical protein